MKASIIRHQFVEVIPETLEECVLYVSIRYRTASHLCACGCGSKVVTPIKPNRWRLTFNGDDVSLSPSIGRGQFPCRSHYWIEHDRILWARELTDKQVAASLDRDALEARRYYAMRSTGPGQPETRLPPQTSGERPNILLRAWRRLGRHMSFRSTHGGA